ncbi:MAG: CDP-archaeol synthase [Oleiphilaceae bacterium]|nr:CDP-archaeol synthase [Oleiphilaceae bacterium]
MTLALALFLLLVVANGSPVLAQRLLQERWSASLDGGRTCRDGRRLLGADKTWRGLLSGSLGCGLAASLMGLGSIFGLFFGLMALLGDLASSFIKRRVGLAPGARATGLDQLPEAVLPLLLAMAWLDIGWVSLVVTALVFTILNIVISPALHRLGIRRRPH